MTGPVGGVQGLVAALDAVPAAPLPTVLALGANLGDRERTLRLAVARLRPLLADLRASPVVETDPVGGPEQPDFLNAVVLGRTRLAPRALLRACRRIEADLGRERVQRWGPRTLDVDVVAVGTLVVADPELELPHPRAHRRAFVLAPWAALDPAAVLPGPHGGPVAALAAAAPDAPGVRRRDDLDLHRDDDLDLDLGRDDDLHRDAAPASDDAEGPQR